MTIVAWDGTTLASDSLMLATGYRYEVDKIAKANLLDGSEVLVGVGGQTSGLNALLRWIKQTDMNLSELPDCFATKSDDGCQAIVIIKRPSGKIEEYLLHGNRQLNKIKAPFTLGSGTDTANVGFLAELNSVEIVALCIENVISCGGSIQSISFTKENSDVCDRTQ